MLASREATEPGQGEEQGRYVQGMHEFAREGFVNDLFQG
jgi:hypothetical protein